MTRANRCMAWIGMAACAGIVLFICGTIVLGKQPARVQLEVVLVLALVAVFAFNPGLKKGAAARSPWEIALTAAPDGRFGRPPALTCWPTTRPSPPFARGSRTSGT